jgi:YbgC/YbaW family acyl-CoA thioester hydrolase
VPFIWKSRIRFSDTDATGRIHFSSIFRHLDAAEDEFFRDLGRPYTTEEERDYSLPRVHVEADYKAALKYGDELAIEVCAERIGVRSFTLGFVVRRDGAEAVLGRYVVACMDKGTQRSRDLPQDLADVLRLRLRGNA